MKKQAKANIIYSDGERVNTRSEVIILEKNDNFIVFKNTRTNSKEEIPLNRIVRIEYLKEEAVDGEER